MRDVIKEAISMIMTHPGPEPGRREKRKARYTRRQFIEYEALIEKGLNPATAQRSVDAKIRRLTTSGNSPEDIQAFLNEEFTWEQWRGLT